MINNRARVYSFVTLLSATISIFGMERNYFSVAPKEIQRYILMLSCDKSNLAQSIRNVRAIDKNCYALLNKNYTTSHTSIQVLAQSLGITPRAIALHMVYTYKLTQQEAQTLLASYSAHKELDQALLKAVKDGDVHVIQDLLKQNADVNAYDKQHKTALMWAAHWGNKNTVELLLIYGADVNAQDKNGWTALMWSIWADTIESMQILLQVCPEESLVQSLLKRAKALIIKAAWPFNK